MQIYNFSDMKGGWFVGNFHPTAFKTKDFEVSYKYHKAQEKWPEHYHAVATEINFLISGKMMIKNSKFKTAIIESEAITIINPGGIFVVAPYEVIEPHFLEDCYLIVVKTPSVLGDKYEV